MPRPRELLCPEFSDARERELLKRAQAELGASATEPASPPITIKVYSGTEEAAGSTQCAPVAGNRIQDIRMELKGNIEGIGKDVLPREISHIVFAEQIGIPPRWADFGVGFLAESAPTGLGHVYRGASDLLPPPFRA